MIPRRPAPVNRLAGRAGLWESEWATKGTMAMAGRGVLVTGAGGRIGAAIVRTFAGMGDRVVAADVDEVRLNQTVAAARQAGGTVTPVVADLTREADIERLAREAIGAAGQI